MKVCETLWNYSFRGDTLAFIALAVIVGLVIGYSRRGKIGNLANYRIRKVWMVPIAYLFQFVSIHLSINDIIYGLFIVLSYVILIGFCYLNVRTPGCLLAGIGTLLNFLEMALNGLRMPAYAPAVRAMGMGVYQKLDNGSYAKSVMMNSHTVLPFLGDIIPIKLFPPSVVSIGDCMFSVAIVILIVSAMTNPNEDHEDYADAKV